MKSNESILVSEITELEEYSHLVKDVEMPSLSDEEVHKESILRNLDIETYDYLTLHIIPERKSVVVKNVIDRNELNEDEFINKRTLVNLGWVNKTGHMNKYLRQVNKCLPDAGIYIGCFEPVVTRKRNLYKNGKNIFKFIYWLYCFIFHRVFPKTVYFQKIYFFLTKGRYRWVTMAEVLGRLVSCGFDIIEFKEINGIVYFVTMKTGEPLENQKPSYGPVFPMNRVGKNGEMLRVYKVRTMHPYSEYLQDFVVKLNGYDEIGKIANDFRLTRWGKFFRKYWLDELPQLLNVLKGEMKIVGVRPLSRTKFNELPKELQEKRIKFKPGCIPPYVALLRPDEHGDMESEMIYINEKIKRPYTTDIKYFFVSLYNIFTGKITSG